MGQEHEYANEIDQMISCFDKTDFPKIPASYILMEGRYCYLWDKYHKGLEYVCKLIPAYLELKILDTTFLHIRGMPFFQQTWQYIVSFSKLMGDYSAGDEILEQIKSTCHEADFELIEKEYNCIKGNNFTPIKERLIQNLAENSNNKFPTGYQRMQLAILEAYEIKDYNLAIKRIDEEIIGENDFQWLNDIKILAKASISSKFNMEEEVEYQNIFLQKQALLFEPDNCLNFFLLDYQEKIKKIYREHKTV